MQVLVRLPKVVRHGVKDVATPGTAVALGSGKLYSGVRITPKSANAGNVYIGGVDVDATNSAPMASDHPGIFVEVDRLDHIFVDADTGGDGVFFIGG